jgi:hypothetical protein
LLQAGPDPPIPVAAIMKTKIMRFRIAVPFLVLSQSEPLLAGNLGTETKASHEPVRVSRNGG